MRVRDNAIQDAELIKKQKEIILKMKDCYCQRNRNGFELWMCGVSVVVSVGFPVVYVVEAERIEAH